MRSEPRVWAVGRVVVMTLTLGTLGLVAVPSAQAQLAPADPSPLVCDQYAGDPAFGTPQWYERDRNDVACSMQRQQDNLQNPAFFTKLAEENATAVAEEPGRLLEQAGEPTRPRINPISPTPTSRVGDPFRMPDDWEAAGRGQMERIRFVSSTGAHLVARLYAPSEPGTYPGIMFSPGLQSYNEVNAWFAQALAEAGYVVLIIDPQGQGDSENCGHAADGTTTTCTGQDDITSSINFLLSTPTDPQPRSGEPNAVGTEPFNPMWELIDRTTGVGIAGHSQGAIRVTPVAQTDPRVSAVVSFDNLDGTLPSTIQPRTPGLYFYTDYAFPTFSIPKTSAPDPRQHMGIFNQLTAAGVDAMSVTTRASTHYEWGYQPFPASFPASRYGERISVHYTLAWFDRYLKHDPSALARLTTSHFDDSADQSSIGAGTYDPALAAASPGTPGAGNVPYTIAGRCVADLLSFYFHSAYSLDGGALTSDDMRARGCTAT
jgi:dienelactone hydrolase